MSETNNQDITEVRKRLFAVMDGLTDKAAPMDIDRAKAVVDAAQTIINSAKVEVDFLRVTSGGQGSGFLGSPKSAPALPPGTQATPTGTKTTSQLPSGATVTRHTLRG